MALYLLGICTNNDEGKDCFTFARNDENTPSAKPTPLSLKGELKGKEADIQPQIPLLGKGVPSEARRGI
ncbi:MAG: hypothetical protein ACP5KZ_06950 [bacterium]